MQSRRWTFTIFDMEFYNLLKIVYNDDKVRFICYQGEITPTTCRPHLQGYIEFYGPTRRNAVTKIIGTKKIKLFAAKGNADHNIKYCSKLDTAHKGYSPIILGVPGTSTQGKRTDLDRVSEMISKNRSVFEVAKACPREYIKYHRGIEKLHALHDSHRAGVYIPNFKLIILYGETGAHKTRHVLDKHGPSNVYQPLWNGQKFWFSSYRDQKVLLINEFYGQCRTSILQQLTDCYYQSVESKGGIHTSNWDTIYITSNCHPKHWYNDWCNIPDTVTKSIMRRITAIRFMESQFQDLSWESIPEYKIERVGEGCKPSITPHSCTSRDLVAVSDTDVKQLCITNYCTTPVTVLLADIASSVSLLTEDAKKVCQERKTVPPQKIEEAKDPHFVHSPGEY